MPITTWVNGQISDTVSVQDRGLQYGDGVFETIAVLDEQPLCWERHLARLARGCQRLHIPFNDFDALQTEVSGLIKNQRRAVLKIIVTRGAGMRGYRISKDSRPSRMVSLYPWPDYPAINRSRGVVVRLCQSRYGANEQLAGIKHLNRLEQILAANELTDSNAAEGIVMDQAGQVIEGTMSNIFIYADNRLLTPELSQSGVTGIIRQYILEHAQSLGLIINIEPVSVETLLGADEAFLCNSLIGLWPIRRMDARRYADFKIGPRISAYLLDHHIIMPV